MRVTYEQFKEAVALIDKYKKQTREDFIEAEGIKVETLDPFTKLMDCGVSIRLHNRLFSHFQREFLDTTLHDMSMMDAKSLLMIKGFGIKCLRELETILSYAGLTLKP